MLCCTEAFVEGYDPTIKLNQKQLLNLMHQIKPNEPLPKEIDGYKVKLCDDYSKRHLKVIQKKDPWLLKYPTVGIMGWDGKDSFKVIKRCKIKYRIPNNDWIALAKGMILKLSNYMKEQLKGSL